MKACTMAGGGVMFIPDEITHKKPKAKASLANDNKNAAARKRPLTGKKADKT